MISVPGKSINYLALKKNETKVSDLPFNYVHPFLGVRDQEGVLIYSRPADGQRRLSCLLCHPLHGMNVTYALHQQRWTIKLMKRILLLLLQAAEEK